MKKNKTKTKSTLWLNIVTFSLLIMIGIAYIAQVNYATTRGYKMRDLEHGISDLRVQNEQLEYQVAELESMDSVTRRLKMLGLVKADTVSYTTSGGSSVAVNR